MIKRYRKSGHSGENNQKTKLQEGVHTHSHLNKSEVEAGTEVSGSSFPSGPQVQLHLGKWALWGSPQQKGAPVQVLPAGDFASAAAHCPPVEWMALSCPDTAFLLFLWQGPVQREGDVVGWPGSDKLSSLLGPEHQSMEKGWHQGFPELGGNQGTRWAGLMDQGPLGGSVG